MKRVYNAPFTREVHVQFQQMIAASPNDLVGSQEKESFDLMFSDGEFEGEAASRSFNAWDD